MLPTLEQLMLIAGQDSLGRRANAEAILDGLRRGGSTAFATLQAEQRVRYEEASKAYAEQAEQRIERECNSLSGAPLRGCIRQEIEATEDQKRSERDLNAQEVMARA